MRIPIPSSGSGSDENDDKSHAHAHAHAHTQLQAQAQAQAQTGVRARTHTTPTGLRAEPRTLMCTIQASRHNHVSAMTRNPYHTFFYVDKSSHMYEDLVKTGIPLDYLADGPMRRKKHVPERVKRNLDRDIWRFGGKSLMGLYRFGVESEGENGDGNGMEGQGEKERKDGEGEGTK